MNNQRLLMLGGLLLFLLSLLYGLYYDGYLNNKLQQSLAYNFDMALNMAVKGDLSSASAFAGEYSSLEQTVLAQVRVPQQLAAAGTMTIVPLWLVSKIDMSERMKRVLALMLISGGLLSALGQFVLAQQIHIGYYLTLLGYSWSVLALIGYLLYAVLFVWLNQEEKRRRR